MEQLEQAPVNTPEAAAAKLEAQKKLLAKKKRIRRIRNSVIALVLVGAAGFGAWKLKNRAPGAEKTLITDEVHYDAITAKVEGSGLTKAKKSETISVSTVGTVLEVFVTEGQQVMAGDPLFNIDSDAARTAVEKARKDVEGFEKQIAALYKDIAGLHLAPSYAGKLLDTVKLNPGDTISKGQRVATLVDDTRLRLTQYYSYAYEGQLKPGQEMQVSIPALMSTLPGTVEAVHMVSRITPEGTKLFSADILVSNPGTLTAEMAATATAEIAGETIYPYEQGSLEYYRTGDLCSTVSGTVISSRLVDYLSVSAAQTLVEISGDDSENEIFTIEQSLENAREELEKAQQNLENCHAVAPIDGTIIGLAVQPGDEVNSQNPLVTISDTSTIIVNATVDERNVSYLKPGMSVDLDQWGNAAWGVVESVSLSSTVNNGVATYPVVIAVDNFEGNIQVNSYISYSLVASQNDNCLVLPLQAVRTVGLEDGSMAMVVYVQGDRPDNAVEVPYSDEEIPDGFWPVPVEIGIQDTYNVEIKSGVEAGTIVFTQMRTDMVWG